MSDDNVVKFRTAANPDDVLEQAVGKFNDVLIIGWDKDDEFDCCCSDGLAPYKELVWLLHVFKTSIIEVQK